MKSYLYNIAFFPIPLIWITLFILIFRLKKNSYLFLKLFFLIFFIISLPIFIQEFSYPLTKGAPIYKNEKVSSVLVLTAGSFQDSQGNWHPSSNTIRRVVRGDKIARLLNIPLIISGGTLHEGGFSESSLALNLIEERKDIYKDIYSKNTHEAAKNLKVTLLKNGINADLPIILVTSPIHNLRTALTLKSYNYDVIIYDKSFKRKYNISSFIPDSRSFVYFNNALYEYMGIIKYILNGYIKLSIYKI